MAPPDHFLAFRTDLFNQAVDAINLVNKWGEWTFPPQNQGQVPASSGSKPPMLPMAPQIVALERGDDYKELGPLRPPLARFIELEAEDDDYD
ncbi:hypothetical protein BJ912DRAFT_1064605 [Pholiota molesta]|nr:hypothetical protein BJ912DRAFT_1064605 [Pholiota molesta]